MMELDTRGSGTRASLRGKANSTTRAATFMKAPGIIIRRQATVFTSIRKAPPTRDTSKTTSNTEKGKKLGRKVLLIRDNTSRGSSLVRAIIFGRMGHSMMACGRTTKSMA